MSHYISFISRGFTIQFILFILQIKMGDSKGRILSELRIVDLKAELSKRGLPTPATKAALFKLLDKWLTENGHDSKTYRFKDNDEDDCAMDTNKESSTSNNGGDMRNNDKEVKTGDDTNKNGGSTITTPTSTSTTTASTRASNDGSSTASSVSEVLDVSKEKEMAARSIWIKNLKAGTKAMEIKAMCQPIGYVVRAKMFTVKGKEGSTLGGTGATTGLGYVTMSTVHEADLAVLRLDKSTLKGVSVEVSKASPDNLPFLKTKKTPAAITQTTVDKKESTTVLNDKNKETNTATTHSSPTKKEDEKKKEIKKEETKTSSSSSTVKKDKLEKTTSSSSSNSTSKTSDTKDDKMDKRSSTTTKDDSSSKPTRPPIPERFPKNNTNNQKDKDEKSKERSGSSSSSDKEKRELARKLAEKEEAYKKREEELKLQKERERIKYQKEKVEKERLQLQLEALKAQVARVGEKKREENNRDNRDRSDRNDRNDKSDRDREREKERERQRIRDRASYIAPAAPPRYGNSHDDRRPPITSNDRYSSSYNDRRPPLQPFKRDLHHTTTTTAPYRREDDSKRRRMSPPRRDRGDSRHDIRSLSTSAFLQPTAAPSRSVFPDVSNTSWMTGAYNTSNQLSNPWATQPTQHYGSFPRRF